MIKGLIAKSLLGSFGIYSIANIINAALPFLLLPVLTRYLTPTDYGIIAMFQVLTGIINPLIGLNIHGAISRQYYEQENIDLSKYIFNCIVILVGSTIMVYIIITIFRENISTISSFPSNWLIGVVIYGFFQFLIQSILSLLQAQVKPVKYSVLKLSYTIVNMILILLLIINYGYDWRGKIISDIFSTAVFGTISFFILLNDGFIKFSFKMEYIIDALSFGAPLVPHTLGAFVITYIDRIFITKMVGLDTTGIYAIAYQIGMIISLVEISFNIAWVPWLFGKLKTGNRNTKIAIVKSTYYYMLILFILALLVSIFAGNFLSFFIGKEFYGASEYVVWIAFGYAFNGMGKMFSCYLFYIKKTNYLALITFTTAALNVVLNYLLIKQNGAIGAAQSTVICFFISFVMNWITANKFYKMPWGLI